MSLLTKYLFKKILLKFSYGYYSSGGRNKLGRICVYHRGAGHKRVYKHIDFFRRLNQFGLIVRIFKDNFRTSFIALVLYKNGFFSNIIISENLSQGSYFYSGASLPDCSASNFDENLKLSLYKEGSALSLNHITLFTKVNNIELYPYSGAVLCRSAGMSALFIGRVSDRCLLKLSSGWQIGVSSNSISTLGLVSNVLHRYYNYKKAGKKRNRGFRPVVRGVIKNPCDHPHGGGEGRGSPPRAQVTPWGKLTKGTPTTNKKKDRLKRRLFKTL